MHALRRLTPVLEHALVHLDSTLFIFGLIFKISAIIKAYTIEKTKKTMQIRTHNIKTQARYTLPSGKQKIVTYVACPSVVYNTKVK